MQSFRTEVPIKAPDFQIKYSNRLFSVGSCFSENIGMKFKKLKFDITINPFGQQYNPASIYQGILRLAEDSLYDVEDLIFNNQLYHSFDHHSSFSGTDAMETVERLNSALCNARKELRQADIIFITPGTSYCFYSIERKRIVNNCHKIASNEFEVRLLNADEVYDYLNKTIDILKEINPNIKIIFTVSPIRYKAFGYFENNVSKGNLFSAIWQIMKHRESIYYFPAYEIILDELRDYRFYKEDMLHPNAIAIDYVWKKLSLWFSADTVRIINEVEALLKKIEHRPRALSYEAYLNSLEPEFKKMKALYGFEFP
jgi:hypothetical protein